MASSSNALVKAILYADLFDFPLTKQELFAFAIGESLSKKTFNSSLKPLPAFISYKDSYFFLKGREQLIPLRRERELASKKKVELAHILASYLSAIPTVQFVGLSGGVAMENADAGDDIDFFVITKKNTLWITRLLCLTILQLLGRRRSRKGQVVMDMICLNMLVDETTLGFPKNQQNLYTAHEIVQLRPLFSRSDTYSRFLQANSWTTAFLPHVHESRVRLYTYSVKPDRSSLLLSFFTHSRMLQLSEVIQRMYMGKRGSKEEGRLSFFPHRFHEEILARYRKNVQRFMDKR